MENTSSIGGGERCLPITDADSRPVVIWGESGGSTGPIFIPVAGGSAPTFSTARRPPDGIAIPWNGVTDSKFRLPTNERRGRTDAP